jgi:hypothetical protein
MSEMHIGKPPPFPDISPENFQAFCSELKQLYVCITRTKQDLIFFDEDEKVLVNIEYLIISHLL